MKKASGPKKIFGLLIFISSGPNHILVAQATEQSEGAC